MKEIKLSQEGKHRGKYVVIVDDEDFEYLNQFKWFANNSRGYVYACRNIGTTNNQKIVKMHHIIMGHKWIDHINGNTLDCQRENMRKCNHQQNQMNRKNRTGSISKYKGVAIHNKRWSSHITKDGNSVFLGYFEDEIEAAKAYDSKAKELFGQFARLNFP